MKGPESAEPQRARVLSPPVPRLGPQPATRFPVQTPTSSGGARFCPAAPASIPGLCRRSEPPRNPLPGRNRKGQKRRLQQTHIRSPGAVTAVSQAAEAGKPSRTLARLSLCPGTPLGLRGRVAVCRGQGRRGSKQRQACRVRCVLPFKVNTCVYTFLESVEVRELERSRKFWP